MSAKYSTLKVAIVDDTDFFRNQQVKILQKHGIETIEFSSLGKFLDVMEENDWQMQIDCFLIDRNFESENLDSVEEKIGTIIKEHTQAKAILWSCSPTDPEQYAESGFDAFCPKGDDVLPYLPKKSD